jgi:hypothetical protein
MWCHVFGRKAARGDPRGSGSDDQGTARAGKCGAKGLDGGPLHLAVFFEFREVMNKGGVNYAIGNGRSTPQALQVFEAASMHLGTSGGKRCAPASERAGPST